MRFASYLRSVRSWVGPLILWSSAVAAPVSPEEARQMVVGWLATSQSPLGTSLAHRIRPAVPLGAGPQGQLLYYVISLQPQGFVIASAETQIEPIVAFSASGQFNPDTDHPLRSFLDRDFGSRLEALRQATPPGTGPDFARAKWARLSQRSAGLAAGESSGLDDLRVAPLLQSQWGQDVVWNGTTPLACFNYFTPPYSAGSSSNYPCGCNATAWGQILRYFQYPTQPVGTGEFDVLVDSSLTKRRLRGGDGQGGPYRWDLMALAPNPGTPELERRAIGALTADLGLPNGTKYLPSGSAAMLSATLLTNVFHLQNAVLGMGLNDRFVTAVNASLDARLPVMIQLLGNAGLHAAVCDGYGFNLSTPYHHLNLGWGAGSDAWYALPGVGTPYAFNAIGPYFYNIYTNGTGEILSGRITTTYQAPISNALVRLIGGTLDQTTVTDERGVYAFAHLPSATPFFLTVTKAGYRFWPQCVTTGTSQDSVQVGNRWGLDFADRSFLRACVVWGIVRRLDGGGCPGVTVQCSDGAGQAVTDAEGRFVIAVPVGWSGRITPALSSFAFLPVTRAAPALTSDYGDQNFVAQVVTITGTVSHPDGLGLGGVRVQLSSEGGPVETDASGHYQAMVPVGWSGAILSGNPALVFSPRSKVLADLTSDVSGQDFVACTTRLLVDPQARGCNYGSTWANALTNLSTALAWATPGTEIWVAAGTYLPGQDRSASFRCPPAAVLYGGFAGSESALSQRDWQNHVTMLSGDIGVAGNMADNCYHVVTGADGARLDGFTVTGGCANGVLEGAAGQNGGGIFAATTITNFLVANCILTGNFAALRGGASHNALLVNCLIHNNTASQGGGVASCSLTNCQIADNWADTGGGGVSSSLINCRLTENHANAGGGAADSELTDCLVLRNSAALGGGSFQSTLLNCTVVKNEAGDGAGLYSCSVWNSIVWSNGAAGQNNNYSQGTFAYSCTWPDPGGDHNLVTDPSFVNPDRGDYRLAAGSLCINRGANQPWMDAALDLAGQPRRLNGTVDLGAFETAVLGPVLSLAWSNGVARVGFPTRVGTTYVLEYTDSLASPVWQSVSQLVGDGQTRMLLDPSAAVRQRLYRIREP